MKIFSTEKKMADSSTDEHGIGEYMALPVRASLALEQGRHAGQSGG
jgi:hypothetical protein